MILFMMSIGVCGVSRRCKMCCDPANNFSYDSINGECHKCGNDTVNGEAFDVCNHSSVQCDECGYAPCNDSC